MVVFVNVPKIVLTQDCDLYGIIDIDGMPEIVSICGKIDFDELEASHRSLDIIRPVVDKTDFDPLHGKLLML